MGNDDSAFVSTVRAFYDQHGRHTLPWRRTCDPYRIAVSEIMLQQTQVDRVVPKYQLFIKTFPNTKQLALSSLADVLVLWQGLGYNRRAQLLKRCAEIVHSQYRGRWPKTYDDLKTLPGIGPYTAGAIMAFAYNEAVPLIETNVRTVYLHHFFTDETDVTDAAILALITKHLPYGGDARTWYAALMDYGNYLKKEYGNLNRRSRHYTKQSPFKGSNREVRGAIIRTLSRQPATRVQLSVLLRQYDKIKLTVQLERLVAEGLVVKNKQAYCLPS